MTTDNFCFYLQSRLIQTSQTGGQQYSDTSLFSIPWTGTCTSIHIWAGDFFALFETFRFNPFAMLTLFMKVYTFE